MSRAADPNPADLAWLTVRTALFGIPGDVLAKYLLRAMPVERDELVREIKLHRYWAAAGPLPDDYRAMPEVTPDDVRRELYWLFED